MFHNQVTNISGKEEMAVCWQLIILLLIGIASASRSYYYQPHQLQYQRPRWHYNLARDRSDTGDFIEEDAVESRGVLDEHHDHPEDEVVEISNDFDQFQPSETIPTTNENEQSLAGE